ncbi:MAG: M48 family metallopeptidase [Minwuia sp.]|nr:M48 family metallopeptidase [Minwuia sp.]
MKNPAIFLDGTSAREHDVQVGISPVGITFRAPGHTYLWDVAGLDLVDHSDGGKRVRFSHASLPDARLIIADPAVIAQARDAMPGVFSNRRGGVRRDMRRLAIGVGGVSVGVLIVIAALPLIVTLLAALVPASIEEEFGEETRQAFAMFMPDTQKSCVDAAGLTVLQRLTDDLTVGQDLDPPPRVKVVPHDLVNAMAFPGGQIMIFRGLIDEAQSGEEVAGVLAHEIGHVAHRHGVERIIRDSAIDAAISVFIPGTTGGVGGQLATLLASQSYGRDAERQADRFAVERLNELNVRTDGLIAFFDRAAQDPERTEQDQTVLRYLQSHPSPTDRVTNMQAQAKGTEGIMTAQEWAALRNICNTVEAD